MATAEDVPGGASIRARALIAEARRDELALDEVTALQDLRPLLPCAMRDFVAWLQPQMDQLAVDLPLRQGEWRARLHGSGGHLRTPDALATLLTGLEVLSRFLVARGHFGNAEATGFLSLALENALELGAVQGRFQRDDAVELRFVRALQVLLAQGRAVLVGRYCDLGCDSIGWRDDSDVYLVPEAVREAVAGHLRATGEDLGLSPRALHDALVRARLVMPGNDGRAEQQVRVGPSKRPTRVLKMRAALLGLDDVGAVPAVPAVPASRDSSDHEDEGGF